MSASGTEANFPQKEQPQALALELTCPICLQLFSEPVSLPCGHLYCCGCLQTMGEGLDQHNCPECQAEYRGTKDLVKSFKMCSIIKTYKASTGEVCTPADTSDIGRVVNKSDGRFVTEESGCESKGSFQIGSGSTERPFSADQKQGDSEGKKEMAEPKFRLASQVTDLSLRLEMAESVLKKEREQELEVAAANSQLREKASKLLGQIEDLSRRYSAQVMQLIDEELAPGKAATGSRVSHAAKLTQQLRQAMLTAESLLTEEDEAAFGAELRTLQPRIAELMAKPVEEEEDLVKSRVNAARACPKLDGMSAELRDRLGGMQRALRNALNPSEVTFDPETAHPNLLLSEDLKTATFSAAKQPYPSSPRRFTSFIQVLSAQSFHEGDHCWQAELDGSPWIIGVCYGGKLERSGLPSALESSRSSWCLMWFNDLLTAFEQSHSVPLKKTTVSRRLEIRLSFKTHRLSFYNISPVSGKTHVYTFKANLTEPVHLAYRMMSGHPKARVTIYS